MKKIWLKARQIGLYGLLCAFSVFCYACIELTGWGPQPGARGQVPMSVRQSPGGYRSYHFWHSGLHGGK